MHPRTARKQIVDTLIPDYLQSIMSLFRHYLDDLREQFKVTLIEFIYLAAHSQTNYQFILHVELP